MRGGSSGKRKVAGAFARFEAETSRFVATRDRNVVAETALLDAPVAEHAVRAGVEPGRRAIEPCRSGNDLDRDRVERQEHDRRIDGLEIDAHHAIAPRVGKTPNSHEAARLVERLLARRAVRDHARPS